MRPWGTWVMRFSLSSEIRHLARCIVAGPIIQDDEIWASGRGMFKMPHHGEVQEALDATWRGVEEYTANRDRHTEMTRDPMYSDLSYLAPYYLER